jgi:hypothetical protein
VRSILYRRWAPAASPIQIEFLPEVLHSVRAETRGAQDRGYLFGRRQGNVVRVEEAVRTPYASDPRLAELDAVGIYVARTRGEVFLTDADLEQAARVGDGIALVVAGARAGFFPYEADGTIQAVRSHEEFFVADAAPPAESPEALVRPRMIRRWQHPGLGPVTALKWGLRAVVLLGGPVIALAYLQPRIETPLELSLRETQGQLVVSWDPAALPTGGHLEISEGDLRKVVQLAAHDAGVTYIAESGDVEIRLKAGKRAGAVHWRSSRR